MIILHSKHKHLWINLTLLWTHLRFELNCYNDKIQIICSLFELLMPIINSSWIIINPQMQWFFQVGINWQFPLLGEVQHHYFTILNHITYHCTLLKFEGDTSFSLFRKIIEKITSIFFQLLKAYHWNSHSNPTF